MGEDGVPADQAEYEAERDRLIAEFARAGGGGLGWVAEQVLDFKWNYLDGDLLNWSPGDVDEVLFGLYPAKVILEEQDIAEVPTGFASFLRFLAARRPGPSEPLEVLAESVEGSASSFVAAMGDEGNGSFGKRLWTTAAAEGVDPTDQDAIHRWMEDFNSRPLAERDQILGRPPEPADGNLRAVSISFRPVVLAPEEELGALAADAVLVRRLAALVEYVGAGRAVTDRGNLKLADGKELVSVLGTDDRVDETIGDQVFKTMSSEKLSDVDWTYRIALEARMLTLKGRKLLPGPNAEWVDAPLDVAYGALLALLNRIGPTRHHYRSDHYGFDWFADELDSQLAPMLVEMYRDGEPREIEDLAATMWEILRYEYDLSDVPDAKLEFHRDLVDWALRRACDRLAELNIVEIADEVQTARAYGLVDRSGGIVGLTPLGLWALQRLVARFGDAPIVGALRDLSASELLSAAGDLPEDIASAEVEAWVQHRGEIAAAALCAALFDADETGRGLGLRALLAIGQPAVAAVETLRSHADLADFVTVFRVDTLTASPDEMDRAGDPEGWIRLLQTVLELWGPDAVAAAWAVPAAGESGIDKMLEGAWRVAGPATGEVLGAISARHPDKHIAKAARKALFKHSSAR